MYGAYEAADWFACLHHPVAQTIYSGTVVVGRLALYGRVIHHESPANGYRGFALLRGGSPFERGEVRGAAGYPLTLCVRGPFGSTDRGLVERLADVYDVPYVERWQDAE